MTSHRLVPAAALLVLAAFPLRSEVTVPKILGSHMVLQRERPIHLWGWSEPGEKVSVAIEWDQPRDRHRRPVGPLERLPASAAGGRPVSAHDPGHEYDRVRRHPDRGRMVRLRPIEYGNAAPGLPQFAVVNHADEEIRGANQPLSVCCWSRRRRRITRSAITTPSWTACTPETAAKFSAVAYFFGNSWPPTSMSRSG